MLPNDAGFMNHLSVADIDADQCSISEKQLLLLAIRMFFGSAQKSQDVKDVSDPASLSMLAESMHHPGERYELLENQTSLPSGFFNGSVTLQEYNKLYAARQSNGVHAPSYFVYEPTHKLTLYIGPDFLHGIADHTVINCMTLNDQFDPTSSHTFRV